MKSKVLKYNFSAWILQNYVWCIFFTLPICLYPSPSSLFFRIIECKRAFANENWVLKWLHMHEKTWNLFFYYSLEELFRYGRQNSPWSTEKKNDNEELETLPDPSVMLNVVAQSLNVDESTVSEHLKSMGIIHKQWYWQHNK